MIKMKGKSAESDSGLLLGMDTCGAESSLALGRVLDGSVLMEREATLPARAAGTHLTSAIEQLLAGREPQELTGVVVVRGPGSFTGMRIGLSAAKALAEALQIPLFGVSRLALLASLHRVVDSVAGAVAEEAVLSSVALDAGRGRVYVRPRKAEPDASIEDLLLSCDELRAMLSAQEQAALLVCEEKVHVQFPRARLVAAPKAAQAITYALQRVLLVEADDPETLDALYIWRPEQMLIRQEQAG